MENLEEVLQALDEFQKMRPTEIPRELEDYLCWVAKTGDPVYQWPMIKTLFREKLTRVMTDFYESCPSLELAPCPNVEHFNYDTMKTNLLERLESFANAPFTVQRICELLTAPRKEYNRVDKFMRAIEKNILVVSTREPGPIARRGEMGDGMVNGSVEEDTASVTQQQQQQPPPPSPPPSPSPSPSLSPTSSPSPSPSQSPQQPQTTQPTSQDVEMEYWEKDCASTVTISVHTVENEPPLLHTVVSGNTGALAKNAVFTADEATREKHEQAASRTDQLATSNFISATSDFSAISNLTAQVEQSHEALSSVSVTPVVQNLPTPVALISEDSPVGAADVTEAIMNEDTNSQPGLDMENEDVQAATVATTTTTTTTTGTTTATTTITMTTTTTATTTTIAAESTFTTSTSTSAATTTVTVVATVIPLTTDTTRKLHAAFHAKHFESGGDNKCLDKTNEKTPVGAEEGIVYSMKSGETMSTKPDTECAESSEMSRNESRLTEDLLKTDVDMRSDNAPADNAAGVIIEERINRNKAEVGATSVHESMDEENLRSNSDEGAKTSAVFVESQSREGDGTVVSDECVSAVIVSSGEALHRTEKTETRCKGTPVTSPRESFTHHDHAVCRKANGAETTDAVLESIPRIASNRSDGNEQKVQNSEVNADGLKMTEISNGKATFVESTVPDAMRIAEKPEETTAVIEKLDPVSPVGETIDRSDSPISNIVCQSSREDKLMRVDDDSLISAHDDKAAACNAVRGKQSSVIESVVCRREHEPMELMDVDEEESTSTFVQQDEQMEHETTEELPKS